MKNLLDRLLKYARDSVSFLQGQQESLFPATGIQSQKDTFWTMNGRVYDSTTTQTNSWKMVPLIVSTLWVHDFCP